MTLVLALLIAQAMPGMVMPPAASPPSRSRDTKDGPSRSGTGPNAAAPRLAQGKRGASATPAEAMAGMAMPGMTMGMGGDAYQSGSGTSRVPADEGAMRGRMIDAGGWMLMAHGYAWGTLTHQGGPRGDEQAFVTSMAMLMGDRDLSDRVHLQLSAMGSLDPYLGPRGYPDLFATGEVAHGRPLVDRQHPHDLVMALTGRVDDRLGSGASVFLYGGPVGEPALGPAAFMHRGSARYLPLAPITHHWFDSTHIT